MGKLRPLLAWRLNSPNIYTVIFKLTAKGKAQEGAQFNDPT